MFLPPENFAEVLPGSVARVRRNENAGTGHGWGGSGGERWHVTEVPGTQILTNTCSHSGATLALGLHSVIAD